MFQFTTTTVINSSTDSSGLAKFSGGSNVFTVKRVNKFLKDNVLSVYKRSFEPGILEQAHVTIPTVTKGLVIRLTIDIRLSQQTESEYANTYLYFKKPVVVEVIATGTASTDAAALVAQLNSYKTEFGWSYVTASANEAVITLVAINNNQRFFNVIVESETSIGTNSIIEPEYTDITAGTFAVTVPGHVGFGDDEFMVRSIMVPTYENTRYFGINSEERPIIGGNYSEYVIKYQVDKHVDDGIQTDYKSTTTHVFYVLSSLTSAFDAALSAASLTVTSSGLGSLVVTGTASIANGATDQLSVTGATGTVVYSVLSGTSATVNSASGLVTADAVVDGVTVIKATDALGNTGTFSVTVA